MFTRRPVLSSVMSIVIVLLGLLALQRVPMSLFPSVAPPEVNVTVEYTGANAETVTKAAIVPLERAINGVPGMKYMSSDAGNDGVGVVQVLFETGTNPDVAAINVQNRVNAVMGELPPEVTRNGVKIAKEENAMLLYLNIYSSDPEMDEKFLYNFADINVLADIKRINGVGYADIIGAKEYAMRVWLKPDKLAAYGVGVDDVLDALEENNIEAAPGKLGENSDRGSGVLQYTLTYGGKFTEPEAYGNIPVRAGPDGDILRVRDVADVELGTTYFDVAAKFNGRPAASIMMKQLPGSNASEVIAAVKERLAQLKTDVFLPGMDYEFSFDVSRFLDAAIAEVRATLIEAFLLVAFVVFIFLRDWRSTLVPILAVPVSLIGTFAAVLALGFSLNLVTLFALVLAIGIVVDNAIVVVEAVHAKMEASTASVIDATVEAMREIAAAILAITLVMGAVFLPLAFMSGPAGVFYRQFALTMAVAIGLSGLVALTLTPALCGVLLRKHAVSTGRFFRLFDFCYAGLEERYARAIRVLAPRPLVTAALVVATVAAIGGVARTVPTGFIPSEDQGTFYVSVTTPPGSTLERTRVVVDSVGEIAKTLDGVISVSTLAGTNILSDGTGATYGTCLINLADWGGRTRSVDAIMDELRARTRHLKDAELEVFPPPTVPGYGNASGFELRVLDKTGRGDVEEMEVVVGRFVAALKARPEIGSAFSIFNAGYPQYVVDVDLDKAARHGVTIADALGAMQTLLGSEYATNFIRFGQMYKVMVQALPEYRATPEDVLSLRVRNSRDEMIPLSVFVTLRKSHGIDQATRYNMYPSAELNGEGRPGVSSGTTIDVVRDVARLSLPKGFAIDWAGMTRDEVSSSGEGLIVFLICLVFVYLVLAAQYESFTLPIVVVLSLPPGVLGAFVALRAAGLENNIYTHLALVMLIGLLGKNAILIVEFAEQRRREGLDPMSAVFEAGRQRLRPVVMTSLAFVAGLIPLALASGAGAAANRTIGMAAVGGMVVGTVGGLLLVPGLYLLVRRPVATVSPSLSEDDVDDLPTPPTTSAADGPGGHP
jgi:HAE1 family hydrophobic/amphiphilic exporter-1